MSILDCRQTHGHQDFPLKVFLSRIGNLEMVCVKITAHYGASSSEPHNFLMTLSQALVWSAPTTASASAGSAAASTPSPAGIATNVRWVLPARETASPLKPYSWRPLKGQLLAGRDLIGAPFISQKLCNAVTNGVG